MGRENIPEGKALLAPNHLSFLDPPLVAASVNEPCYFLAKQSLFNAPLLGTLFRHLNVLPVRRNQQNIEMFKIVGKLLEEGKKVIVFPEGKRSSDGTLQPLKKGVAMLALKSKTPIVPVIIKGSFEAWPRDKKGPRLFGKTACYFGEPIAIEPFLLLEPKESVEKLTEELYKRLNEMV